MSIKLGTNFDLKSKQFLDSRQGLPNSKDDLRDWSTPVPPGFEVCLNEIWYYYDPGANLSETGHWVPRLVGGEEIANSGESIINGENRGVTADAVNQINTTVWAAIDNINSRLDAGEDAEAGYKIDSIRWGGPSGIVSGTTFEVGYIANTVYNGTPTISFNITGKNNYAYPESNGRLYWTTGVQETYSNNVSMTISYAFNTPHNNLMNLSETASLKWTYRRFWQTVTENEKLTLLGGGTQGYNLLRSKCGEGELSISRSITEKTFNCTGGQYPFFAVYAGNDNNWTPNKVTVGGFANSNYTIYKKTLINTFGKSIPYFIFMLNQIQTATNIKITIEG